MKITYKKINEILEENSGCDFLDCDTDQTRLCFGTQNVTVKIVTSDKFRHLTGLHLRNVKNCDELERLLLNAVDRALNNDFNTIYVHARAFLKGGNYEKY